MKRSDRRSELLPGTLDLLILQTLTLAPLHGYGIAQHIRQRSGEVLQVGEGSLYPALQRFEERGWITSKWQSSSTGRRARFYRLTRSGRKRLELAVSEFETVIEAISRVLQPI